MQWYFVENGAAVGPFDLTQLEAMAASGRLRRDSQSCRVGASEWIDASADDALRELFAGSLSAIPWSTPSIAATMSLPEFTFSAAFALAIDTFKKQWAMLLLVSVIYLGISAILGIPGQVSNFAAGIAGERDAAAFLIGLGGCCGLLLQVFVGLPLFASFYYCGAQAIDGKLQIPDLFVGFRRYWVTVGTSLLSYILVGVALAVSLIPALVCILIGVGIGEIPGGFFIVVGILLGLVGYVAVMAFVGVRLLCAATIACDPARAPLGVMDSIKASWHGTRGKEFPLLGYLLVVGIAIFATFFLLCIGFLLVGTPFAFAAAGAAYSMLYRRNASPVTTAA